MRSLLLLGYDNQLFDVAGNRGLDFVGLGLVGHSEGVEVLGAAHLELGEQNSTFTRLPVHGNGLSVGAFEHREVVPEVLENARHLVSL